MLSLLDMDAATWADVNRLLGCALDLPPGEREAWLQSLGPAEQPLLPRLRQLLKNAARVETGDFLETLPTLGGVGDSLTTGAANTTYGPYRLLRELGRGGMGAVWLAERTDGILNRPVALKLPHIAAPGASLRERMAREREILASLTHPHIARLYDAGVTAQGQPWLALEYVEGEPIDRWCRSHSRTLRQKLALFQQVVGAVAHAHSKLVLHRDLKPPNVLVSPDGQVRLLDFGIAKLLAEGVTRDTALTEFGGAAFTPDYASPEQIRREPLSIQSDVYSLGVILYELLADARPYKLKRESRGALEDAILQADPVPPSESAPTALRKALRGDLDTIVLKALKKNPRERYATVNALGEDIARFLDDRPVQARPDSGWYRCKKFVSRNRLPVAAASAIVLAVVGGALVSLQQSRIAIQEKERAQEVERFVQSIFGEANPYADAGRKMTAVELLHNARADIDRKFKARPDLRVRLLEVVGSSLRNLGDIAGARSALQAGLAESQQVYGPRHIETLRLRALLTEVYFAERDAKALKAELQGLVSLARASSSVDAEPLVRALKSEGLLAYLEGRNEEIAPSVREALGVARKNLGDRHPLTIDASNSLVEAISASYSTPPAVALEESERGLELALAAYGENSDHAQMIRAHQMRARVLGVVGFYREAIAEQRKALDSLERSIGLTDHTAVELLESIGSWERRLGELQASLQHGAKSVELSEKLGDTRSPDYAFILTNHGVSLTMARRPIAAAAALERAEKVYLDTYGPYHWDTLTAHLNRAMALAYGGKGDEALASFAVLEDPKTQINWAWWVDYARGTAERLAGHPARAVEALTRANQEISDTPRAPWDRVRVFTELGQAQLQLGALEAADTTLAAAEALDEKLGIEMTPAYADVLLARARIDLARNAPAQALPRLQRVDGFWQEFDAQNRAAGEASLWLSRAYGALGNAEQEKAAKTRALRLAANPLR